ncbi:hypothetical protein BDZ97DRAFT_1443891 [Flammula alnicola]|nr:hypothetical protein BDZ97DRAFT_1443891 [Flammula alnicola]
MDHPTSPSGYCRHDPVFIAVSFPHSTTLSRSRGHGGVILGLSIMRRIPGFKNAIFPPESIPLLTATSTIGLILFLFLMALEIDIRLLKRNVVASASVSIAGLDNSSWYGRCIRITAFPVLFAELKLLDMEVGLIVLSAGIGNDVIG